jgi:MauM/NapG family ferredoxin protein
VKRFQRATQTATLTAFLLLLMAAGFPLPAYLPVDGFLRMDPLAGAVASLSARHLLAAYWPALLIVGATFVLGRFFCGHVCPMGTTIDLAQGLRRRRRQPSAGDDPRWQPLAFYLLAFLLGSAAVGISLVFLASPMALITRFYGNLIIPVVANAADGLLRAAAALPEWMRPETLIGLQFPVQRFAYPWFLTLFFLAVFAASRVAPRFWCRYVCPAGAILALCSRRPWVRRQVSDACTDCGQCQKACPMGAIAAAEPRITDHAACISCQGCVSVCPVAAVSFPVSGVASSPAGPSLERRRVLGAGVTGAATALVSLTGLHHVHGKAGSGQLLPPALIRPPGSLPENGFLARCLRCGACMAACPTNTLQPLGLAVGFTGLFSPVLTPQRGPCEPGCNVCGWVCPTGAIRALPLQEKTWAKMGTAHILKEKCLAWEFGRRCLVCDEVCPYDAVELKQAPGIAVGVPVVHEDRCAGCGLCQHHCPVQGDKAIVVGPMGALRLATGSYVDHARSLGLTLELTPHRPAPQAGDTPSAGYPGGGGQAPGFSSDSDLPPGFTR